MDDVGSWWCLRAPSGRTGHVPKTCLEIIPNPAKGPERFKEQTGDPIVVKVPVIVKAAVHRQEVEDEVKSRPAKQRQATPPPTARTPPPAQPQPGTKPESPASPPAPSVQKAGTAPNYPPPPPQSIFPPLNYNNRQPSHTVIREVIREIPPYREYRRAKSKYQAKRDASPPFSEGSGSSCTSKTSSSSGISSFISDGTDDRKLARQRESSRNRRSKAQQQTHKSAARQKQKQQEPLTTVHKPERCCHAAGNSTCRYRSVCCYSSKGARARSTITDVSHRESSKKDHQTEKSSQQSSQQQPQQPQQPMIILLEAPKQEIAPQQLIPEGQVTDDYYDPNNQPQISIVLPSNAQLGSAMTTYTPLQPALQQQPQYVQSPTYYNWTPQYYQGYA